MKINKDLVFITLGVIFEKAFPFIISFFFISKIDNYEYGLWILYFQIVLIFSSTLVSPLQLFFSREYNKTVNNKLNIYNLHIIFGAVIFSYLAFLILNRELFINLSLGLLTIITLVLNNLLFNYLRFKGDNFKYLLFSFFRFFSFVILLIIFIAYNNEIIVENLFISYVLSNLIIILSLNQVIQFRFKNYKLNEFFILCAYGILTLSLGGIDKLILLKTNLTINDLAVLGYALVFANSTSVILEGFKKYFSPIFFRDFNEIGFYSKSTKIKIVRANIFLGIFQIGFPFLLFFTVDYFNLIKESLLDNNFLYLIFLLSFSLFIHNTYHFLNPYLFFLNRSHYLSLFTIFVCGFFIIAVLNISDLTLIKVSVLKIISSIILIILTIISVKFTKNKINV